MIGVVGGVNMLEVNQKAYNFKLTDFEGNTHALSDYVGKKVVVYFYPKDNTPGCTRQACAFRDAIDEFKQLNTVVIGISKDSEASHRKFIEKHQLPFILLSDPTGETIEAYGVWKEKSMFGKTAMGIVRSTFVVNEEGVIEKVYKKASPDSNASDIIEYLKSLEK